MDLGDRKSIGLTPIQFISLEQGLHLRQILEPSLESQRLQALSLFA